MTELWGVPVVHSRGCPGVVVPGVGVVIDRGLGEREVKRRVRALRDRLEGASPEKDCPKVLTPGN